MIDTHIYQVLAELPTSKLDERNRPIVSWVPIYCQVKEGAFQYSLDKNRALSGDHKDEIPKCKVINLVENDEEIVKLEQVIRHKDQVPKSIFIKEDESCPDDFNNILIKLDTHCKSGIQFGRPIIINMHTGRGISALSRNAENMNYRGLVTILIILLIISNIQNIWRMVNEKGWVFGVIIFNNLTDLNNFHPKKLGYLLCLQFIVTSPIISFCIEKFIAPVKKVPRTVVFALIVLNMANIIIFPLWCAPFSGMHPIWRALYFLTACTGFLKMLSYHHIWHDVRYHVILANKILEEKQSEKKPDDAKSKNKKLSADVNAKNSDDVKEYSNGILFIDRSLSIDTLVTNLNIPKHTVEEL